MQRGPRSKSRKLLTGPAGHTNAKQFNTRFEFGMIDMAWPFATSTTKVQFLDCRSLIPEEGNDSGKGGVTREDEFIYDHLES